MMNKVLGLLLFLLIGISNASAIDITGIWVDPNNNYFSVQEKDGYVVFMDLSRSTPRAEVLKDAGIETKIEYLTYSGQVSQADLLNDTAVSFNLSPYVDLGSLFPSIDKMILGNPAFFYFSESVTYVRDACVSCSGTPFDMSISLEKVF